MNDGSPIEINRCLDQAGVREARTIQRVRVAIMSRTFFYVPLWRAIEQGVFRQFGYDVECEIFDSATRATTALLDGSLQFALAPTEGVIRNVEDGGPLRIIAGQTGRLSHFMIAQPRFKRMEDLRGAVIGCISLDEGSRFHIEEILKKHGMEYPADYELRAVGGAPSRWQCLQDGSIDAGLQSIPLNYIAEDRGFVSLGAATDYIPEFQFTTVNVKENWASKNSILVQSFLAVLLRMNRWMFANRSEAEEVGAREMRVDRRYATRAWDDFVRYDLMPIDMGVSDKGLAKVFELMQRAGHLPPEIRARPTKYYDLKYLERAYDMKIAHGANI